MGHINIKKGYLTGDGKFPPMISSTNYLTHIYKGDGVFGSLHKIGEELPICIKVDSAFLADKTKAPQPAPQQQASIPPAPQPQPPLPPATKPTETRKTQQQASIPPVPNAAQKRNITIADIRGAKVEILFDTSLFGYEGLLAYYKDCTFTIQSNYGNVQLFIDDVDKFRDKYRIKGEARIGLKIDYAFDIIDCSGWTTPVVVKKTYATHSRFIDEVLDMFSYGRIDTSENINLYHHMCVLVRIFNKADPRLRV